MEAVEGCHTCPSECDVSKKKFNWKLSDKFGFDAIGPIYFLFYIKIKTILQNF
jgi:hypothetical protein